MTNENSSLKELFDDMEKIYRETFNEDLIPEKKDNSKFKAVTIDGKLIRIDENGSIYRLNGIGNWAEITNIELWELVNN